jgi:hypothetical protein
MSTFAIVETATGAILNRIVLEQDSDWTPQDGHSIVEETGDVLQIGGTYLSGTYTPPVLPEPEPMPAMPCPQSISDRQFFQQLAIDGIISEADALASNAAVIPPALLAIIEAMPAEQQFGAKMLVSGATVFERNHPMTLAIAAARGMTSEQVDAFFTAAARL